MKNTVQLLAIAVCPIAVSACNVRRGAGADIKAAAGAIERDGR